MTYWSELLLCSCFHKLFFKISSRERERGGKGERKREGERGGGGEIEQRGGMGKGKG